MIDPVVDLEWVQGQAGRVVLADVRWYLDGRSGRAAYEQGHLPGAVFVDLDRWLAAHGSPAAAAAGGGIRCRSRRSSRRAWPRWVSATRTS